MNYILSLIITATLISCNGQSQTNISKIEADIIQKDDAVFPKFKKGIISIFEDSKGNFWIGSKEEGVCKYDGKANEYFTTSNGLPNNMVREIQEDKKGNIWFTTGKGICFFNGKKITTVSLKQDKDFGQIPKSQPSTQLEKWDLEEESLWFTSFKNGVLRYSNGQLENLTIPVPEEDTEYDKERKNRSYHYPYSVIKTYRDNNGKLLLGTFNRGIVEYDGKTFEYHNPDNFGVGTLRSIFQDDKGNYWFGSNGGGLYLYDGKKYRNFTEEKGLINSNLDNDQPGTLSRVWSIGQDKEGNMWFGTADAGLWKFDGKEMFNYTMKDGLPSNFVETIYKDKKGKLWFCSGMSNGVLYTLNGEAFEIINPIEKK